MAEYTRENPSPEYRAMVEMYETLHEHGAEKAEREDHRSPEETFAGKMLLSHAPHHERAVHHLRHLPHAARPRGHERGGPTTARRPQPAAVAG